MYLVINLMPFHVKVYCNYSMDPIIPLSLTTGFRILFLVSLIFGSVMLIFAYRVLLIVSLIFR